METAAVEIPVGAAGSLAGELELPAGARGLVVFAHGSGSSRRSPRNGRVAAGLRARGMGTLLFDLLTEEEAAHRANVFDLPLLTQRTLAATRWIRQHGAAASLPLGYFGASTGAAAALVAAGQEPEGIAAVVSRGGRPDLAGSLLERVLAPTLLIVGGADTHVLALNCLAFERLRCPKELFVVPGAGHLFEEPGAIEEVMQLACAWFGDRFPPPRKGDSLPNSFADRREAGWRLAEALLPRRDERPVVLALPRGGVVVGYEIAAALRAPLDVLGVRKIGAPWQPEFAIGAIVGGTPPTLLLHDDVVRQLGVDAAYIESEKTAQLANLARQEALFRRGRPAVDVTGATVLLVDDGIATGATMEAAARALRRKAPRAVVIATPVAPRHTIQILRQQVDDVVCLLTPPDFRAVGQFYDDFRQVSDEEVVSLLDRQRAALPRGSAGAGE